MISGNFGDALLLKGMSSVENIVIMACQKFQYKAFNLGQEKASLSKPDPLSGDALDRSSLILDLEAQSITSSYMIGRVAVSLMLMESNGGSENWEESQEVIAVAKVIEGLDTWSRLAYENNATLTWCYDIHLGVPTNWEPIEGPHPVHGDYRWINDALGNFGYGGAPDGLYDYLRDLRRNLQCDWDFFTFIAMDEADPDNRFQDGFFAYAYLGGPFLVMTYDNDGWTHQNMNQVMQHETGHIFGAGDEYMAGCNSDDCANNYGFLHVPNANCNRCNSLPDPCIMLSVQGVTTSCYFTKGHIGWHDYDGDLWNDAPDRNTRKSQNIWNVNPGDFLELWDLGGNLYKVIYITPDNSGVNSGGTVYVWDCTDYEGNPVINQNYLLHVNGAYRSDIAPSADNSPPVISNLNVQNRVLYFDLYDYDTAGDITRIRLFQGGVEVYRPVFDKFLAQGVQVIDLSSVNPGNYNVEIRAWDAGGNAASPLIGSITLTPEVPTGLYVRNQSSYNEQWQNVLVDWDAVPSGIGVAVERKTASSNWAEIGRVTGQAYFEDITALGSEYYYYRIRAYYGSFYSDYSGNYGLRVWPQIPLNFVANAGNTNRVKVSWSPPTQQLPGAITGYMVRRKAGLYSAYFGPFTSSPVSICSALNAQYVFGVKTMDQYNNSSEYTKQDVVTGSWNNCQITPDGPDQSKQEGLQPSIPQNTMLFQNSPNPFNSSTRVVYGLSESSEVTFSIYDLMGRIIKRMNVGYQQAGYHLVIWDGTDLNGLDAASGIYFFVITTNMTQQTIKVLLLR